MNNSLERLERYILYIVVFLLPVFVLSAFVDSFGLPKLLLLALGVTLILVVKAVRLLIDKKMEISVSNFDIPLLVILIGYVVSSIFTVNNKMEAFFLPGSASIVIGSVLLYFFLNNLNFSQKNGVKVILFASSLTVALTSVLAMSGVLGNVSFLKTFFIGKNLSLPGGGIPQAIFLAAMLPISAELIINTKDFAKRVFLGTGAVIVTLSLVLCVVAALPGKPDTVILPDFRTSFAVTLDTLKESPIFGAGAGNYLSAFNKFRPVSYNATNIWQVRFSTASNYYFTAVTETGLIGLAGIVLLLVAIIGLARKVRFNSLQVFKEGHILSLFVLTVALGLFPANITLISLFFVFISLCASTRRNEITIPANLSAVPYLIAVPVLGLVSAFYFFSYSAVSAEHLYRKSLESLNNNNAKETYDLMRQAITLNPYVDRYHASYAQVNMAIAQSMAQQGEEISDADRETIATLIQQAIREGKNTVFLNPTRSNNWELLANVYQAIMPFAQGADQFTLQTYAQAISLDPINPGLRIALGGVYYNLGQYDSAVDVFKLAVAAKPDYPNSHYNLSAAYREKKEYDNAIAEMNAVLSLVEKDSQDYKTAETELENLKAKRPATQKTQQVQTSENLTPPVKEEPAITPPLELPEEATPPASE